MANKELTARVKLDTKNAEQRLKNLAKAIDTINNAVNKQSSVYDAVNKALGETASKVNRVKQQTDRVKQSATEAGRSFNNIDKGVLKVSRSLDRVSVKLLNWSNRVPTIGNALDGIGRKFASISGRLHNLVSNSNRWSKVSNTLSTAFNKINGVKQQISQKVSGIVSKVHSWASAQSKVSSATKNTNSLLGNTWNKLKGIAATYLGIMGARAIINTSDVITSAENRLNAMEGGNPKATAETMDKIYVAAQRARTSYTDMLAGASKSMTIAGDAFQGNIDNAIRFEEIMSKSFTVAGASADEMRNSMYQLRQALGSGILQGDELKAVMEQAPLMYDEIEKFVQGVLNTDESLKKLASDGLVTSDMVVRAVMEAGNKIDKKFEETEMTFAQAFDNIKNTAVRAFQPVLQTLNDALNSEAGQKIVAGIGEALVALANVVNWVFGVLGSFFTWCSDNWYWLQWIVYSVITAIVIYLGVMAAKAIWAGIQAFISFLMGLSPLYLWIIVIGMIIAYMVWLANTTSSVCEFIATLAYAVAFVIVGILLLVAITYIATGTLIMSTTMMVVLAIIAIIALLVYAFFTYTEQVCGGVWVAITFIGNLIQSIVNFIMGCFAVLVALIANGIAAIVNFVMGAVKWIVALVSNANQTIINAEHRLVDIVSALAQNIGIAFQNAWNGALSCFWNFIASCLEGLDWLAKPLSAIAELFGKSFDYGSFTAGVRAKADSYQQKEYVTIPGWDGISTFEDGWSTKAWSSGWNTMEWTDFGEAWNIGSSVAGTGLSDWSASDAYNTGAQWGTNVKNSVNEWGAGLKDKIAGFDLGTLANLGSPTEFGSGNFGKGNLGNLDNLTGLLNPDDLNKQLNKASGGLPDYKNSAKGLGDSYDPTAADDDIANALKKLGNIDENTGSIADSMELTEDDIEMFRKLAEMEWKKEFTTANITVDMSNYNTINGDNDLDGIVTKLADKLYEEMDYMANGVYA